MGYTVLGIIEKDDVHMNPCNAKLMLGIAFRVFCLLTYATPPFYTQIVSKRWKFDLFFSFSESPRMIKSMYHMVDYRIYQNCICRRKMHCGDRKTAGTEGFIYVSYMPDLTVLILQVMNANN